MESQFEGGQDSGSSLPVRRKHAPEYRITVASKLDNLAKIGTFVSDTARRLKVPDATILDIQVAVEEACTNIIQHSYALKPDKPISVGCRLRNREFIVRIRDFGATFVPESISPPVLGADISERRANGLGMYLMKKLMTRVKFNFDDGRGNELTMVKKLPEPEEVAAEAPVGS
jgi:anti-sigma regulatory factor (Ser/Thr protein kinase)